MSFDFRILLWFGLFVMAVLWGGWEAIDYFFIDEVIESSSRIEPELQLTIKNNVVDTIYIYRHR